MKTMDYIKQFPVRQFTRGSMLVRKGDPLHSIMAVRTGYVKITSITDVGSERLVWIAGRYDFVPIEQLFSSRGISSFFYTALTDGSYYDVDRTKLIAGGHEYPEVMTEIARGMSEHYDDLMQRVDTVESISIRERLLKTLHYLANKFSAEDQVDLYAEGLPITHQDLAGMIGSTRETTSTMLSKLRKDGYINYDRKHFIIDAKKIATLFE